MDVLACALSVLDMSHMRCVLEQAARCMEAAWANGTHRGTLCAMSMFMLGAHLCLHVAASALRMLGELECM